MLTPIVVKTALTVYHKNYVKFGDHAICSDIWGDQFDISVVDDSYENGVLNVSLEVKYNLVDKNDEVDPGQVSDAIEAFLSDSSYLQKGSKTVKSRSRDTGQDINLTGFISDKSVLVNISFQIGDKDDYTFVVSSYPDINHLTDKQLQQGIMQNLEQKKFTLK